MPLINNLIRMAENATVQYGELTHSINNTSFSDTVHLQIKVDNQKPLYSSGDIISGEVTLTLKREVDIAELSLKYKIDEATEIIQIVQRKKRDDRESFKSAARIYEKTVKLFPRESDIGDLNMNKLTLPAGNHRYPFSVRIPGHSGDGLRVLPPSFIASDNKANVSHTLKATLKRASTFKQNSRSEWPLVFIPRTRTEVLGHSHWVYAQVGVENGSIFNRAAIPVKLAVSLPVVIQAGSQIPLKVLATSLDGTEFAIVDIRIDLLKQTSVSAHDRNEQQSTREGITQRNIAIKGVQIDAANKLGAVTFPLRCVPSFKTKNIALRYRLEFIFRLSSGSNGRINTFHLYSDVNVVGPAALVFERSQSQRPHTTPVLQVPPNTSAPHTPLQAHTLEKPSMHAAAPPPPPGASPSSKPAAVPSTSGTLGSSGSHLAANNPFSPQNTGRASPVASTHSNHSGLPKPNDQNPDEPPPAYSLE